MSKKKKVLIPDFAPLHAPLLDSHCHTVPRCYGEETGEVIKRAFDSGICALVVIGAGYGMDSNYQALDVAEQYAGVHPTVGIHPHDAHLLAKSPELYDALRTLAKNPRVVAYGEIGLDYHYNNSTHEQQHSALREQIKIARETALPIVVHDRDAHDDVIQIFDDTGAWELGVVIHCFSGDWEFGKKCLDRGALLSLPGVVTFPNAAALHDVAARVPIGKLLVETDSPYLAPVPYRGKRNEPAYVHAVVREIGRLRGMDASEVAQRTTENARRFFRLATSSTEN